MPSTDRVEKVEKVEMTRFNPSKSGRERVEKVESTLVLNLSNPSHHGPSASQLAKAAFDGRWDFWQEGDRVRIPAPDWLAWPSHTAAEMGPPLKSRTDLINESKMTQRRKR